MCQRHSNDGTISRGGVKTTGENRRMCSKKQMERRRAWERHRTAWGHATVLPCFFLENEKVQGKESGFEGSEQLSGSRLRMSLCRTLSPSPKVRWGQTSLR